MKKYLFGTLGIIAAFALTAYTNPFANHQFKRVQGNPRTQNPNDYLYQPTVGSCKLSSTVTCLATFSQASAPIVNMPPDAGASWISDDTDGNYTNP